MRRKDRHRSTHPAKTDDEETVEEGVIILESLVNVYSNALSREEVERICRIVCDNFPDGELRRAKLNEKLIEAAIEKSIHSQDEEWEVDRITDGGLEFRRDTFNYIYQEIFSSEDLDRIWEECESIDMKENAAEEDETHPGMDNARE